MVCEKAGRLRLIYWYHHCEDSTVAYLYLCWLRRHECYWKDLWRKQFASFSSCPYGNEKNSGLVNHTAQDGKGYLGLTVRSSECCSSQYFAILNKARGLLQLGKLWGREGKGVGENRENLNFLIFFLNIPVNT